jgi:hypothetical protein
MRTGWGIPTLLFGATKGIRTLDLAFTKRLLYRLSYGGVAGEIIQEFDVLCNILWMTRACP